MVEARIPLLQLWGSVKKSGGIQKCSNPYNITFEDVCAEVMGTRQKEQLRRMIGFKFKRHPSLNLPEEHLAAIERVLEIRVRKLLAIPVHSKST